MDVILDTNIFRSDFALKSKDIGMLKDYLKKTGSSFKIPQIILDETKGLFRRTINERLLNLNKAINNFNNLFDNVEDKLVEQTCEIDIECEKYENFLKKSLSLNESDILQYNNDFLIEIARRAINREKPCGDDGQGFRDALIWLTIKEYAAKSFEKQVIFVSNNHKDFGSSIHGNLHEQLEEECKMNGIRINYFKSIREFIENHSTKVDFITNDWISEQLDDNWISDIICERINNKEHSRLKSWYENKTGNECTGYHKAVKAYPYDHDEMFVYEMIDNTFLVNVTIRAEVEVEFEIYRYYHGYEEELDGYGYHGTDVKIIDVEMYCTITLVDNEVSDIDIADWSYYH